MRPAHRIRAYGARIGMENSFVPLLDAHLVPEDDGCRLSGTLGWARWVRVQSAGGILFAALWTLGSAVGLAMRVHGPFLPFLAIGAAMTGLGVCLPGWAGRAGWRDADFLLDWLHERLQVPGHPTGTVSVALGPGQATLDLSSPRVVDAGASSGRSLPVVPYTPRPRSPLGWARLGFQAVAMAAFLLGVTNVGSHRWWAIPLIVIAVCANTAMVWLNYRAARHHHESLA
jgi:hypothetical protein